MHPLRRRLRSLRSYRAFVRWWNAAFRLTLHEEFTFSERWQFPVTRGGVVLGLAGSVAAVVLLTYFVVARTPLREALVPGYLAEDARAAAATARADADKLEADLVQQEAYLANLRRIFSGDLPEGDDRASGVRPDTVSAEEAASMEALLDRVGALSTADTALRNQIAREDRYALDRKRFADRSDRGIPFLPVDGTVSAGFDAAAGHYGIDFVAPAGSLVHAADDGTVLFAGFTVDGGYTVILQHARNRTSVYQHNASLLHTTGDRVRAGDPIAVIGNTGRLSTGPHCHFEWWVDGSPLNPKTWLPASSVPED